jgi:hypothetical protein
LESAALSLGSDCLSFVPQINWASKEVVFVLELEIEVDWARTGAAVKKSAAIINHKQARNSPDLISQEAYRPRTFA